MIRHARKVAASLPESKERVQLQLEEARNLGNAHRIHFLEDCVELLEFFDDLASKILRDLEGPESKD